MTESFAFGHAAAVAGLRSITVRGEPVVTKGFTIGFSAAITGLGGITIRG